MAQAHKDGPVYPVLTGTVAKLRRVKDPTREQTKAHGEAVLSAIRALQRSELARVTPSHASPCASGTWESDGNAICKAIRSQHDAKLQRDAKADRARRTDDQIREQYEAAMAEKRARLAAEASGGDSGPRADNVESDCDSADDGALEAVSELSDYSVQLNATVATCVVVFTSHAGRCAFDRSGIEAFGEPCGYRFGDATIALADADQVARLRGNRLIGLPRKKRAPSVATSEVDPSPTDNREATIQRMMRNSGYTRDAAEYELGPVEPVDPSSTASDVSSADKPRIRVKAGSRPHLGVEIAPSNSGSVVTRVLRYRVKAGSRPHVSDPSPVELLPCATVLEQSTTSGSETIATGTPSASSVARVSSIVFGTSAPGVKLVRTMSSFSRKATTRNRSANATPRIWMSVGSDQRYPSVRAT